LHASGPHVSLWLPDEKFGTVTTTTNYPPAPHLYPVHNSMHNFRLDFPFPKSVQWSFRSGFFPERVYEKLCQSFLPLPLIHIVFSRFFSANPADMWPDAPPTLIRPPCARPRGPPTRDCPLSHARSALNTKRRKTMCGWSRLDEDPAPRNLGNSKARITPINLPPDRLPGKCHMPAADSPVAETDIAMHRNKPSQLCETQRASETGESCKRRDKHCICPSLFPLPLFPRLNRV